MTEENLKPDSNDADFLKYSDTQFKDLGKEDLADTLSWYMIVFSLISIAIAGLCIYLRQIHYRDFTLNGRLLGNYFLMFGAALYVGGRAIKYMKRFKKRREREVG